MASLMAASGISYESFLTSPEISDDMVRCLRTNPWAPSTWETMSSPKSMLSANTSPSASLKHAHWMRACRKGLMVSRAYAFVAMYPRKLGDITRMFSSFTGDISMEYPERRRQSFESESRSTSTEGHSNLSKDSLEPRISNDFRISWSATLEMPATRI